MATFNLGDLQVPAVFTHPNLVLIYGHQELNESVWVNLNFLTFLANYLLRKIPQRYFILI